MRAVIYYYYINNNDKIEKENVHKELSSVFMECTNDEKSLEPETSCWDLSLLVYLEYFG